MDGIPQRTVEEIVTLHDLHPALQEVFVEGTGDKNLIEWVLTESGLGDVAVFEIATVSIDKNDVLALGLEDNNHGRVITLASLLNNRIKYLGQLICIADQDFDDLFGVKWELRLLILTDYTSMDLYAFNDRCMDKVLKLVVNGFAKNGTEVLNAMEPILIFQFLVRAADKSLGLNCKILGIQNHCRFEDQITIDEDSYIRNVLIAAGKGEKLKTVQDRIAELRRRVPRDRRLRIHGHDFISLAVSYIRSHPGCGSIHPSAITRGMVASIEFAHLLIESTFIELLARLRWERG